MLRRLSLAVMFLLLSVVPAVAVPSHHHSHQHHTRHTTKAPVAHSITVWVNTNSGVYHYPGERWYGNTNEGQYMSEDTAKAAGYRATENGQ